MLRAKLLTFIWSGNLSIVGVPYQEEIGRIRLNMKRNNRENGIHETFGNFNRFGLVQERGGPCGVMAAVQGALLQTLNFGSRLEGGGGCKVSGAKIRLHMD